MARPYKITLIGLALCLSFLVQTDRLAVCQILGFGELQYVPLMGILDAHEPHLFYRVAHNLTNPLLWVGYGAIIFWWSFSYHRGRRSRALDRLSALVAGLHVFLIVLYLASGFLPIEDMVTEIAP